MLTINHQLIRNKQPVLLPIFFIILLFNLQDCLSQYEKMFPDYEGYARPAEIKIYNGSNLYELINGAAENFIRFGFIELYTGDYTNGDDYITVEIYSMKNQLNSYGVYASERSPSANFITLGAEGYSVKGAVNFVYGPYYIKLFSNNPSAESTAHITALAQRITSSFFACTSLPFELTGLPDEDRIAHTDLYIPENFLGHSFLYSAIICDYQTDEKKYKLFIMNLDNQTNCKQALTQYLAFADMDTTTLTESRYIINDKYNGIVIIEWKSGLLFGVTGNTDGAFMNSMANRLKEKMAQAHLF